MVDSITIQTPPTGAEAPAEENQNTPGSETSAERPDYIPEKFWKGNVEESTKAMAASYSELEKKMGQPKPEETPTETPAETPSETPARVDEAQKELESRGLNFDDFANRYAENGGSFKDEDYAELEKAGIPRAYVDTYLAGQEALATNTRATLNDAAGGEENFNAMRQWAASNWNDGQKEAFNKTMNAGDTSSAILAIKGLRAAFEEANGTEPSRQVNGDGVPPQAADVYRSTREMMNDMAKPEYKTDPAFRKMVEEKLARSNI